MDAPPAGVTQEEGHTGFLIYLPSAVLCFNFYREKGSAIPSLVDREVEFFVPTNWTNRSPFARHLLFIIYYCLRGKIPVRVTALTFELATQRQKVSRLLPSEPPGRPALIISVEVYWPRAGGLSAVNAIGTHLRDPINSGLTRWRVAVINE